MRTLQYCNYVPTYPHGAVPAFRLPSTVPPNAYRPTPNAQRPALFEPTYQPTELNFKQWIYYCTYNIYSPFPPFFSAGSVTSPSCLRCPQSHWAKAIQIECTSPQSCWAEAIQTSFGPANSLGWAYQISLGTSSLFLLYCYIQGAAILAI
jgi:hypothetical protein